jgi:acyl carrier protein
MDEPSNMTVQVRKTMIYGHVKDVLCEALNVEKDDIAPESRIIGDLGAESIDFLDITFRLERQFNIKIPRNELFPENVFEGDAACIADGKITPHGVDRLQAAMPHVALRDNEGQLTFDGTVAGVQDAFTVMSLVNYINTKVQPWENQ